MSEKRKVKLFDESIYQKVLKEVGYAHFLVADGNDRICQDFGFLFGTASSENICVFATTAATGALRYAQFSIPKDVPLIVQRTLRYCNHNGIAHYNADDRFIFPNDKGHIISLCRKDAPDHYLEIAASGKVMHIAEAYHLPVFKSGSIALYTENGALMPIRIDCHDEKKGVIKNITKTGES